MLDLERLNQIPLILLYSINENKLTFLFPAKTSTSRNIIKRILQQQRRFMFPIVVEIDKTKGENAVEFIIDWQWQMPLLNKATEKSYCRFNVVSVDVSL